MAHYASLLMVVGLLGWTSAWNDPTSGQYHIQTDEGNERYFRYQTVSGQYRKEKRLEDGTVVGTYAWIDDDGMLRQRDYIADDAGYRILRTKNLYVGRSTPIAQAIKFAKSAPAPAGTLVKTTAPAKHAPALAQAPIVVTPRPYVEVSQNSISSTTPRPDILVSTLEPPFSSVAPEVIVTPAPINDKKNDISSFYLPAGTLTLNTPRPPPTPATDPPFSINPWYYSSAPQYEHNTPKPARYTFQNGPTYPIDSRGQAYTGNSIGNGYDPQYPYYDGVSVTNDGFRYYIPRAYHEEQNLGDSKSGSFGYIDPFGIRRVIYYNAAPGTGFQHRKNNRYVGFDATPYDPRPY